MIKIQEMRRGRHRNCFQVCTTRARLPTLGVPRYNPRADKPGIPVLSSLLLQYGELDTTHSVGGVSCISVNNSVGNQIIIVRPSRGGELLQRHGYPGYHDRDKPVEIQIDRSWVGYLASRNHLTPRFPCKREIKEGNQRRTIYSNRAHEGYSHYRHGPYYRLRKQIQQSARAKGSDTGTENLTLATAWITTIMK